MNEEMVTITKKEYDELLDRDKILYCLECAGVDNWDGWGFAMEQYHEEEKDD